MGPAALFAVSAGLGIFGNFMANKSEAAARRQNIAAYKKQQQMAKLAAQRQADIFDTESKVFAGDQLQGFAKAGVNLSGSALAAAASTQVQIANELSAIKLNAKRQLELFDIEISKENQRISQLNDPLYQSVQLGTTLLNSYSFSRNAGLFTPNASTATASSGGGGGIVGDGAGGALRPAGTYPGGATRFEFYSPIFGRIGGR